MNPSTLKSRCPLCGGNKKPGKTTYSADLGFGVVVVRNLPATVCDQCGEEWIAPDTAKKIESITEEARQKELEVKVVAL